MKKPGRSITTAIILAGGFGTRLQSVVPDRPKVLAEVAGHPFLHYVLQYLVHQEIQEIILSLGYMASKVIDYVGDGSSWGVPIRFITEGKPLGTAGALRLACQSLSEPFFALNGDTLFLADTHTLEQTHQSLKPLVTMALVLVEENQPKGCVQLETLTRLPGTSSVIHQFTEKPPGTSPTLVNGGIYIMEPAALSSLRPGQPASLEKDIFPLLASQKRIIGQVQDAYFIDIGTPLSLAAFEQDILQGKIPGFGKG